MSTNNDEGGKPRRRSRSLIRNIPEDEQQPSSSTPNLFKRSSFKERPKSIAARIDMAASQRSTQEQERPSQRSTTPARADSTRGGNDFKRRGTTKLTTSLRNATESSGRGASRPTTQRSGASEFSRRSTTRITSPSQRHDPENSDFSRRATTRVQRGDFSQRGGTRANATSLRATPDPSAWGMQGRENVGIGEMAFLREEGLLTTHGLGSCVGIAVYDPEIKLGGLIHIMLPDSTINAEKARNNPLLFADTGLLLLLQEFGHHGGVLRRSYVRLAGGASTQGENDLFHIGNRNSTTIRKLLWRERINIQAEDIGGNDSRTMMLDVLDGNLTIRIPGQPPRSL